MHSGYTWTVLLSQKFKTRYRADEVPWYWQPLMWVVAGPQFVFMAIYFGAVLATARIRFRGHHGLPTDRNYIFTAWHTHAFVYFCVFTGHRQHTWLTHPSWYMKSIHLYKKWIGIRLLLGSAGHGGRAAALELTRRLREGESTVLLPDGPYGPFGEIKNGIFFLSRDTGVPILPIRFDVSGPCLRSGKRDRKRFPLPFARITVHFGAPLTISGDDFAVARATVAGAMGDPF